MDTKHTNSENLTKYIEEEEEEEEEMEKHLIHTFLSRSKRTCSQPLNLPTNIPLILEILDAFTAA
jgi:PII-like signaling protein